MLDFGSIVTWIIIGGIAGWMAGLIVEGYGFGLLGNIVVGIIGAAIAGLVTPLLGTQHRYQARQHHRRDAWRRGAAAARRWAAPALTSRQKNAAVTSTAAALQRGAVIVYWGVHYPECRRNAPPSEEFHCGCGAASVKKPWPDIAVANCASRGARRFGHGCRRAQIRREARIKPCCTTVPFITGPSGAPGFQIDSNAILLRFRRVRVSPRCARR